MTTRWHTVPLRVRLVALGVAGLLIGFAIGGAVLVWALHMSLQRSVDSSAEQTAADIAELIAAGELPDPIPTGRDSTIVQVFDADGRFERGSLGADPLVPLLPKDLWPRALEGENFTVDGSRASMTGTLRATAERAGERTVLVAVSQSELDAVPKMSSGLAITFGALAAVIAVTLWWAVGWTLRPVEAARAKQRAFVADAAHELRSPLANMHTELEVAARIGPQEDLIDDLLTDVRRMTRMTEDLLLLARLDDARRPWRPEPVDLSALLRQTADDYTDARVPVRLDLPGSPSTVDADADGLHRILVNLVDNAVRHADTEVRVAYRTDGGDVLLSVSDDGPGIPPADRRRVFDRFTRLDDSRDRDLGGTGLGLSIVAELVAAHRGTVRLTSENPHGLRAEVRIPR
ncbi:phospho-acceptor domain-containing protein [Stackebrandtia albiflava]|uniref:histidine kinase n=1 Tax=Stackebrandtia albiflava TaxID=406432 RepID=A0A562UQP7_9ACTN|nr:HAMP domain-containing sensor histidine kinase [Stackebrandtia albiflava]TWJ07924.1 phospho-acceptor domain-containing protein [Stackebrandtia albiflava]